METPVGYVYSWEGMHFTILMDLSSSACVASCEGFVLYLCSLWVSDVPCKGSLGACPILAYIASVFLRQHPSDILGALKMEFPRNLIGSPHYW